MQYSRCHAPRERVSWNFPLGILNDTWSVTLHVSVWVEIYLKGAYPIEFKSRSTWACELKFSLYHSPIKLLCHAPRERVSWNVTTIASQPLLLVTLHVSVWVEMLSTRWYFRPLYVTLHVSVWVEIRRSFHWKFHSESRSTWACELKSYGSPSYIRCIACHAPRERVSWNMGFNNLFTFSPSHAPRERVSWNEILFRLRSIKNRHAPRERVSWN